MKIVYFSAILLLLSQIMIAIAPLTPSSNLLQHTTEGNSIYVSFTKGDGTSRIAILKMGTPVTTVPQNYNSYLANSTFGDGQQVATGEYVVYSGGGASFSIYNLVPETDYYLAIFEMNGSGLSSEFLTTSYLSDTIQTLFAPGVQPSGFVATDITGNNMKISWTAGDGANRIVLAKKGAPVNANPVELISYRAHARVEYRGSNSGSIIGDNNFVVYKGSASEVQLSEMNPDTTYHFAVFEYNGGSGPVYLTTNPLRASVKTLPHPTIASSEVIASQIEGDKMSLRWTVGNGTRRIVVIREGSPVDAFPQKNVAYTSHPDFALAPEIAPGQKVIYNNSNSTVTVSNLNHDSTYYFAIFEYSGSGTEVGYLVTDYATFSQTTQSTPLVNVSNIDTLSVGAYNANLTFTPGNGTGRLIVMKQDTVVDFVPNNYQNYNYNASFGSGYGNLGNGNYAIYRGVNSFASVSLQPNTKYYVTAFEYTGTNSPVFNIENVDTFSFTTKLPPPPTIPSKGIAFTTIEGNSLRIIWTRGDGERRIVIVRKDQAVTAIPQNGVQYTGNAAFNLAEEIEPGQKVIYDGTGYHTYIDSLEIGVRYYVKVIEYNGSGNITNYLMTETLSGSASTANAPGVSASKVHFQLLTLDKLRIFWEQGSGGRRIILGRKNAPVDGIPENLKSYNASSYFGAGSKIGESSVIFSYTGSPYGDQFSDTLYTDVSSMEPGNTYYFKIFEYNGVGAPVYKQLEPGEGSFKITFEPPNPASGFYSTTTDGNSMTLIWTRGGGDKRVIVAREGAAVDVVPQDGVDYAENKDFRLAEEIAPGQRVIYDGTSYFTHPEGFNPGTEYFFKIFEYGGTGADIDYLTAVYDSTAATTQSAPDIQASNLVISGITPESGNVSWTNGNGQRRIVVARKDSPVTINPNDTTAYNSNYFGSGSHLGDGNYVVYKNTTNNFQMLKLEGGTTYHLAVYEANGLTYPMLLRPPLTGRFTTLGPPQVNAVIDSAINVTENSFHIHFTRGSGQKRLVVMHEGSPVDANPLDDVNYIDNTYLGAGDEIGTGNFVVYDGEDDNVIVTGLKPATDYHLSIFEYNAFNGGRILSYLLPSTGVGIVTTKALNTSPELSPIENKRVNEMEELSFTITAIDNDEPVQTLRYTLDNASLSLGMHIDSINGQFSWTPMSSQAAMEYQVTVTVTDDGLYPSALQHSATFTITVDKVVGIEGIEMFDSGFNVFPNPFKDQFNFVFVAHANSNVRIDFYDASGKHLKTIFNQNVKQGMHYSAAFAPALKTNGMYLYKVTAGERTFYGKALFRE